MSFFSNPDICLSVAGGLPPDTVKRFSVGKKKSKTKAVEDSGATLADEETTEREPIRVLLTFKRYIYDPDKAMKQS